VTVRAGGLCQTINNIIDGTNVHVAEQPSTSYRIVSIAIGRASRSDKLTGGSVDITVGRGVENSVTFTNETNLGSVTICKNAGTGIPLGQQSTFTVTIGNQTPFDIQVTAGGLCQTINNIIDGTNVHVAEQPSTSYRIVSI